MSKIYDIWFHKLKLSHYVKKLLLSYVKDFEQMYRTPTREYKEWGLTDEAIYLIEESKKGLKAYEKIMTACKQQHIEIIGYFDNAYPTLLREIPDAPMLLYVKGRKEYLNKPMIGMVGARKCTEYGDRLARRIGGELSECGIVVVSGMAMGIDAASHEGALSHGTSIGVLGNGVDVCYPECNRRLYERMEVEGCLISEYEPGTKARPYYFPMRNRIISGLSYGIAVIEAAQRSGSLITAKLALDYGRDIYAAIGQPGNAMSQGTDELIRNGAKCLISAEDIIEELPKGLGIKNNIIKKNSDKMHNELAQAERIVYAYVSQEPILFGELQDLLVSTQLSYERLNTSLLRLEVQGLIKRLPGERYVRI